MTPNLRFVRKTAKHIASAAEASLETLRDGRVEQEPHFTDRMLGYIEKAMSDFKSAGVTWKAKALTDHGPGAQEREYGADFMGVLEINVPGYSVRKGFLSQSKLIEPGDSFSPKNFRKLRDQCEDMLAITPDSFVFLYSTTGIFVVPAVAVVSSERCNPHLLHRKSVQSFFEKHIECFIGDRRLSTPNIQALNQLRAAVGARSLLYLEAGKEE